MFDDIYQPSNRFSLTIIFSKEKTKEIAKWYRHVWMQDVQDVWTTQLSHSCPLFLSLSICMCLCLSE